MIVLETQKIRLYFILFYFPFFSFQSILFIELELGISGMSHCHMITCYDGK